MPSLCDSAFARPDLKLPSSRAVYTRAQQCTPAGVACSALTHPFRATNTVSCHAHQILLMHIHDCASWLQHRGQSACRRADSPPPLDPSPTPPNCALTDASHPARQLSTPSASPYSCWPSTGSSSPTTIHSTDCRRAGGPRAGTGAWVRQRGAHPSHTFVNLHLQLVPARPSGVLKREHRSRLPDGDSCHAGRCAPDTARELCPAGDAELPRDGAGRPSWPP